MRYEEDRERAEAGTVPHDGTRLVKGQVRSVKMVRGNRHSGSKREWAGQGGGVCRPT